MSDLFDTQDEVTQLDCDEYAKKLVNCSVTPLFWQGYHSYTLLSDSGYIVQFRSPVSPLKISVAKLAKEIHGKHAPETTYHGCMPNSTVTVWVMERMPGTGFIFTLSDITKCRQEATISSIARFFAASWRNPQPQDAKRGQYYEAMLLSLEKSLPHHLKIILDETREILNEILTGLPWVLTHTDLSNANILVDAETGDLTGVVDWAECTIEPFGMVLWGLESVLGYSNSDGWSYFDNLAHYEALFRKTFFAEIGTELSPPILKLIEGSRKLGILLRFGFSWVEEPPKPNPDVYLMDIFLINTLFYPDTG